jgi:uncharacterized protein YjbI with pentapeptide repeats
MSDDKMHTSLEQYQQSEKTLSSLKKAYDFFSNVIDLAKDSGAAEGIKSFGPWAKYITEAGGETFAVVKFVLILINSREKHLDPLTLGHIALTTAFQWAADKAIREIELPKADNKSADAMKEAHEFFKSMEPTDDVDLSTFSFDFKLNHPFIKKAEIFLNAALHTLGFSDESITKIIERTRDYFDEKLALLLSHPKTKEKFTPFYEFSQLAGDERQAHVALIAHAEYQRWLFHKYPILGKAPFALEDIFVEPECGNLQWGKVKKDSEDLRRNSINNANPFLENYGGNHPLVNTVMDLIADSEFKDAIIIQGIAGAGKSSFTLKLCDELIENGFRPIRIRLRDLRLDIHISESLPEAVRLKDDEGFYPFEPPPRPKDLFLGGKIFREAKSFRGASICRYVLILDGWDEITLGVSEGFKIRVGRMLEQIRSEYLTNRDIPVRLILTGRPTSDVIDSENHFFRTHTRLLTIRPLNPESLNLLAKKITKAAQIKPIQGKKVEKWKPLDLTRIIPLIQRYTKEFNTPLKTNRTNSLTKNLDEGIGIIGLPLLAYLTFRLVAEWEGNPNELVENPTTLYRNLINLTCGKGGKASTDASDIEGQARIGGANLRRLLHQTASAMTILGLDAIPRNELQARLDKTKAVESLISEFKKEHILSSLVISFYFKSGSPNLGCEFAHKSFREYLFAEAVIETLKDYGRECRTSLPEKGLYWKDFDPLDSRYNLSRELSKLLAPQWLTPEVVRHLDNLINWEINRPLTNQPISEAISETEYLDIESWKRIRDGLADLWDWWGEGAHLRPIIKRENVNQIVRTSAFVEELIKHSVPLYISEDIDLPVQVRSTTMDGHLGDGIFRLCVYLHHYIYQRELRGEAQSNQTIINGFPETKTERKYQSIFINEKAVGILFNPLGEDSEYFKRYSHRINSAGWRPLSDFPAFTDLRNIDLEDAILDRASLDRAILNGANLVAISLNDVSLNNASLEGANLVGANLEGAILNNAILDRANLNDTNLDRASLEGANLDHASLEGANLNHASLIDASLIRAILNDANLEGAILDDAILNSASLKRAILNTARLNGASLNRAILNGAILNDASLNGAILNDASTQSR